MSELLTEIQGSIATLTFNRPERMNTISGTMLSALAEQLLECDRNKDVRVIVITGAGRAFCAGLDLQGATKGGLGSEGSLNADDLDLRDAPPNVLHNIDTPTICALNGGAAGYGMDLAMGCDIRIAADTAKLSAAFTKRGMMPESGGTWILPRLLGWAKAAEIIFTGKTLTAEESLELGLVNRVVPAEFLMKESMAMAQEIAENAPLAVQASKRMMRMALQDGFDDHVHRVFLQLLPLMASSDFREGVAAYLEKRKPEFKGK